MQYSRPVRVTLSTVFIISIGKLFFYLSSFVFCGIFFISTFCLTQEAMVVYIKMLEYSLIHSFFSEKCYFIKLYL